MKARLCAAVPRRTFFGLPSLPPLPSSADGNRKSYAEQRVLGYRDAQMFAVVADMGRYKEFVPWCTDVRVTAISDVACTADMEIGFPPISERYTSHVTLKAPSLVRSISSESRMFKSLSSEWRFGPGLKRNPDSCTLHYMVSFEFKSALHSHLAHIFFDQVVKTMVGAFLERARNMYGPPSIPEAAMKPKVVAYKA